MSGMKNEALSVYAELLSNIRQVSVVASLPSPPDASTTALVSADGAKFQLRHGTVIRELILPGQVAAPSNLPIQARPGSPTTLAWRLPVVAAAPGYAAQDASNPVVPWKASDLVTGSAVSCRQCGCVLVAQGKLGVWKDLPSENWAEMMDFWHCHKPHDDHGHGHGHGYGDSHGHSHDAAPLTDEHLAQRAYGANSTIAAQPSVGFVDLTTLLFSEDDCIAIRFSASNTDTTFATTSEALQTTNDKPASRLLHALCAGCSAHVGFFNIPTSSISLFKWQLTCQTSPMRLEPTSSDCLAAALLATLARTGSSKSVVIPTVQQQQYASSAASTENNPPGALHLWILNGNITYSSTNCRGGPSSALKLLYRQIAQEEADKMLESFSSDVQEVNMPTAAISSAVKGLGASSMFLPVAERTFKDWQVGLLDKWVG